MYNSKLKILDKIGNGHFGVVFRGEDPVHGEVAVKVLERAPFDDDNAWDAFKKNFLAEAQFLSKAQHKNVVQVHHIVEAMDGQSIQFCMAYCPGGSLQTTFETGPMTLSSVRKVGTDVAMGLAVLHAREMLHRDIKPGNILLDAKGVAKIADFGLVTDDLILGYGSQAGYADHIAYEVWHGAGTSAKTDVWALGMTLYRLLHGRQWHGESPDPRLVVKLGGFSQSLRWLPHVPDGWRRAIRKMMHDDTGSRYQTANQALGALARLPIEPGWDVSVTPKLVRWTRTVKSRRQIVDWHRISQRKHEWTAWSEPLGNGQRKTLGGSKAVVGRAEAVRQLSDYFAA